MNLITIWQIFGGHWTKLLEDLLGNVTIIWVFWRIIFGPLLIKSAFF